MGIRFSSTSLALHTRGRARSNTAMCVELGLAQIQCSLRGTRLPEISTLCTLQWGDPQKRSLQREIRYPFQFRRTRNCVSVIFCLRCEQNGYGISSERILEKCHCERGRRRRVAIPTVDGMRSPRRSRLRRDLLAMTLRGYLHGTAIKACSLFSLE